VLDFVPKFTAVDMAFNPLLHSPKHAHHLLTVAVKISLIEQRGAPLSQILNKENKYHQNEISCKNKN
jgi:hypothetical protein